MSRFVPTLRHMESMAEKDLFAALAPVIQDPIQDGVKTLKALEVTCERVIANGGGEISHDVKTIAALVSDLKRSCMLANQVFVTMSKAMAK